MNARTVFAATLTLALASGFAFAQDAAPTDPPADAAPMASDSAMQSGGMHHHMHHRMRHAARHHHSRHMHHMADMDDGNRTDHSGDHMIVEPTVTRITIPPHGG